MGPELSVKKMREKIFTERKTILAKNTTLYLNGIIDKCVVIKV